jgi:hypothetical protein
LFVNKTLYKITNNKGALEDDEKMADLQDFVERDFRRGSRFIPSGIAVNGSILRRGSRFIPSGIAVNGSILRRGSRFIPSEITLLPSRISVSPPGITVSFTCPNERDL